MNKTNSNRSVDSNFHWQQNVFLPNTWHVDKHNQKTERSYRIFIYKPNTAPPAEGFPVIYVLDANAVFGTFVEAMRVQMARSEKTGVSPAIIIGIGYQTDQPFSPSRFYDFTRPVPKEDLPPHPRGLEWPPHGGAEQFLSFIQEEVKAEIVLNLPVNKHKQTLFGHSLGGLFTLQTLYTKPDFFTTYIAGSPSIHWDPQFFKVQKNTFIEKTKELNRLLNVFIGVGELEKVHFSGMNKNAFEMAEELQKLGKYGVHVHFKEFSEENHGSVLLPLINRAIKLGSM